MCRFRGPTTAQSYRGTVGSIDVTLVHNGKDPKAGVDKVGTNAATLTTYLSIEAFKPDIVISAGTAGGFASRGATIASIFVSTACVNHDRRIPLPGFDEFGLGKEDTHNCAQMAQDLGVQTPSPHVLQRGMLDNIICSLGVLVGLDCDISQSSSSHYHMLVTILMHSAVSLPHPSSEQGWGAAVCNYRWKFLNLSVHVCRTNAPGQLLLTPVPCPARYMLVYTSRMRDLDTAVPRDLQYIHLCDAMTGSIMQ